MAWQKGTKVLHVQDALQGGFEEVSRLARDGDCGPDEQGFRQVEIEELEGERGNNEDGQEKASSAATNGSGLSAWESS